MSAEVAQPIDQDDGSPAVYSVRLDLTDARGLSVGIRSSTSDAFCHENLVRIFARYSESEVARVIMVQTCTVVMANIVHQLSVMLFFSLDEFYFDAKQSYLQFMSVDPKRESNS